MGRGGRIPLSDGNVYREHLTSPHEWIRPESEKFTFGWDERGRRWAESATRVSRPDRLWEQQEEEERSGHRCEHDR